MNRAIFVSGMLTLMLAASAFGTVTLGLTDTDGLLDATSTVAGPGQSFTVAVNLGVSGETVGGVTMLLQADKSNVLKITGRTIQSATLSDPTSDTAAIANLNPVSTQDVGTTTANVNVGVSSSQTLMLLTLQVDPATQPADYPIRLSFAKARWATTGMNSVSSPIDTTGVQYTIYMSGAEPPVVQAAVSRKTHAGSGDFDIPLTLSGDVSVEGRTSGPTLVVVSYDRNIGGVPSVVLSAGVLGLVTMVDNELSINMSGIPDGACVSIAISGIADALNPSAVAMEHVLKVAALLGDVNGNRVVNSNDIALAKSKSGLPVDAGSFRMDVNANGVLNSNDIALVKGRSGNSLPCSY
ncbi:MAG: hypothetical protein HRF43_19235 [Phycisphaerae bacterium]|jgi:hypothetical protein